MPKVITPDELPKWVPGKLLTSSAPLGWKDVAQRSYLYKGQEVPIPPLDHFMIVRYRNGHTPMYRQLEDSKGTRTTCVPGDISLLTNAQNSHWHWTQDIDFVRPMYRLHARYNCQPLRHVSGFPALGLL